MSVTTAPAALGARAATRNATPKPRSCGRPHHPTYFAIFSQYIERQPFER
jgi:hypothetical protein